MKSFAVAAAVGATVAGASVAPLAPRASSLPEVTVKGNGRNISTPNDQMQRLIWITAFFAGDSRFYIRGVDYQPGEIKSVLACRKQYLFNSHSRRFF